MIKTLRKRHLQIWAAWSVLLPVGIISAYFAIPQKKADKLLQAAGDRSLPFVIKNIERKNYTAALRRDSASIQLQLEWKNKTASAFPSSLIYQLANNSDDIQNAAIIGRVEARGDFYFSLKPASAGQYHFVLYDIIHHEKIDSINF